MVASEPPHGSSPLRGNRLLCLPTASGWIARSTALLSIGICGDVEPNGFEQAVPFVDEKAESTPGHGLLHELRDDPLKAEHAVAHIDGFFEQVGDGVLRQCKHRPLFSHACLQWFWLSAYRVSTAESYSLFGGGQGIGPLAQDFKPPSEMARRTMPLLVLLSGASMARLLLSSRVAV